jgi:hypothetical protein
MKATAGRSRSIEVRAYDAQDAVVFESGHIADAELEEKPASDPNFDPQLALYRDWTYDAAGQLTHNFWEAAPSATYPDGYQASTLPYTIDPALPHTLTARYTIARHRQIARMTLSLRIRPIGLDVLQDLADSGDLDPSVLDRMPTFTLYGASVEWRPDQPMLRSLLPADFSCPSE